MRRDSVLVSAVLTSAITLLLFGCGGDFMTSTTPPPQTVQPTVAAISPTHVAAAGGASFELVVEAQNVAQGATVNFGSLSFSPTSSGVTFYPSSAALWTLGVQVPASALTASGAVSVSVTNPGSSGGTSNQENFFV